MLRWRDSSPTGACDARPCWPCGVGRCVAVLAVLARRLAVARHIRDAATAVRQHAAQPDHTYVFGVDWGRTNDATAIAVIDCTLQALIALDRFTQVEYAQQIGRLRALAERFRPQAIVAEANSMGGPLIEQLRREGLPVQSFVTTNATKAAIIDSLALAFERGTLAIVPDPILLGELQAYVMERLPSGLIRYGARVGHDDTVMALALALSAASRPSPMNLIAFV
jgi:hypothetical protein